MSPSASGTPSTRTNRYAGLLLLAIAAVALMWPAIYNGQALFSSDTSAYVRGADAAVHAATGISSDWSPTPRRSALSTRAVAMTATAAHAGADASRFRSMSSVQEQNVMAGRSIYYGALLYAGSLAGNFWLTVFVQSMLLTVSVALALQACAVNGAERFGVAMAVLCATPAAFFVSYLMPDVFAGLTILGCAVLIAAPDQQHGWKRLFWLALLGFSLLAHRSHVLLATGMLAAGLLVRARDARSAGAAGLLTIVMALFVALLGSMVFNIGVKHVLGAAPIYPPFIMARLIDDGPGYEYLQRTCPGSGFVACRFVDRLPLRSDDFLWNPDPKRGVFVTSDVPTRRALSEEQYRFAWAVLRDNPLDQVAVSASNMLRQAGAVGLAESAYSEWDKAFFAEKLPADTYSSMRRTAAYRGAIPSKALSTLSYAGVVIALAYLLYVYRPRSSPGAAPLPTYTVLTALTLFGIVLNAAVCGGLSGPHDRYQARVIWLIPLLALMLDFCVRDQWWAKVLARHPRGS